MRIRHVTTGKLYVLNNHLDLSNEAEEIAEAEETAVTEKLKTHQLCRIND